MARKKHKRKTPVVRLSNPEWAKFCSAYHGRGAHQDKAVYERRVKHARRDREEYDARDND